MGRFHLHGGCSYLSQLGIPLNKVLIQGTTFPSLLRRTQQQPNPGRGITPTDPTLQTNPTQG